VFVLYLFGRAGVSLYSRIASGELLVNPSRRRIMDIIVERPGSTIRDVSRLSGRSWGAFRAHLAMLERAGYVRRERHGHYALLYASAFQSSDMHGEVGIPHPVSRAVFGAIPADGSWLPTRDVRERTGLSRQLVDYHVRNLERAGRVIRERGPDRLRRRGTEAPRISVVEPRDLGPGGPQVGTGVPALALSPSPAAKPQGPAAVQGLRSGADAGPR
jgi:DNA-binding MarR family transcriptional regulator